MSKPLFDNVGQELKDIAEAIARIITITYGILGLLVLGIGIFFSINFGAGWIAFVGIIAAILVWVYGYHKAHLQVITLYAYGELVHRVVSIEEKLSNKKTGVKRKQPKEHELNNESPPITVRRKTGEWVCLFCEHVNPAGADWCEGCGVEANFE